MKKIINILCYLVISVLLLIMFVVASGDTTETYPIITYKFDSEEAVESFITSPMNATTFAYDAENCALKLISGDSTDPHVGLNMSAVNAENYKYIYYRFKFLNSNGSESAPQLFFATDSEPKFSSKKRYTFTNETKSTDSWQGLYYDFSQNSLWSGNITNLRVDYTQTANITVLVDSISFCSTEEQIQSLQDELRNMNPGPYWIFDTNENFDRHVSNLSKLECDDNDGIIYFKPTAEDPQFNLPLLKDEVFSADKKSYVAFRMRADTKLNRGSIFFQNETYTSYVQTSTNFEITNDGEWHDYIINMSDEHENWGGTITKLRFDFVDSSTEFTNDADWVNKYGETYLNSMCNSEFSVDRIGIFVTEAEAKEFLNLEVVQNVDVGYNNYLNTGATVPAWDFRNDKDIFTKWIPSGGTAISEHGLYSFTAMNTDAILTGLFDNSNFFSGDEFKYMGMRVKNNSTKQNGIMFFTNDTTVSAFNSSKSIRYRYSNLGEWENIVVNVKNEFPYDWSGNITAVRFDHLNPSYKSANYLISRIGFFRSEEDAYEYLNADPENDIPDFTQTTVYKGDMQHVLVPGGTMNLDSVKSSYMMSSATPVGEGEHAVVMFTDNEGTQSVLPLSDVNDFGFARFVSKFPGTYTIGYKDVSYSDTDNHWAKDNIEYVTAREILNGTSETEFSPDMPITRGMFAAALGRMHGLNTDDYTIGTEYADIASDLYYAPYISWVTEKGIMQPVNETTFAPEAAITRIDMALAIAEYIDSYNHDFINFNDVNIFEDLTGYSEDVIASVESLQKMGIMKGISETQFAPDAITTRAEFSAVLQRTVEVITGAALVETEFTNEDIVKKRIRLGVWNFAFNDKQEVDRLKDLGVNLIVTGSGASSDTVWNLCDKYGIEIFMQDYGIHSTYTSKKDEDGNDLKDDNGYTYKEFTGVDLKKLTAEYIEHPSFGGHFFIDEPGTFDFGWIGDAIDAYNEVFPRKTAFVNLLPMYAKDVQLKYGADASEIDYYDPDPELFRKYCEEWFATNDAPYICTDIYPLNWKGTAKEDANKTTYENYIESINQIATVARENNNAEFWCCIQAFGRTSSKRTPNEAEFRWQSYSLLSFGATGILLWRYANASPEFPSMIDMATREIYQSYYDCQKVFAEINKISDIYIQYTNLGAFTHNCSDAVPYLKMSGEYDKDATVFSEIQCSNPLLFGYFENTSDDSNAFTVVNMTEFSGNESSVLKFSLRDTNKTVKSYYRGDPVVLAADENGYYTINLECGDGVFVTVK